MWESFLPQLGIALVGNHGKLGVAVLGDAEDGAVFADCALAVARLCERAVGTLWHLGGRRASSREDLDCRVGLAAVGCDHAAVGGGLDVAVLHCGRVLRPSCGSRLSWGSDCCCACYGYEQQTHCTCCKPFHGSSTFLLDVLVVKERVFVYLLKSRGPRNCREGCLGSQCYKRIMLEITAYITWTYIVVLLYSQGNDHCEGVSI